ncbi:MAG: T9SS C-terminal target domain-containing protein [Calditrichaeota bacterium]|nr:MAG: T9SS C-terminal target domain-containing protein [Calditrichota bacterium]
MKNIIKIILFCTVGSLNAQDSLEFASMSTPRAGASAVAYRGKIYIFGGKALNNKILNKVDIYDPSTNKWDTTSANSFKVARYNAAAVVWRDSIDRIYLTGGFNGGYEALESVEVYDPVQNTWEEVQDLHEERSGHSLSVINDRMHVIGGLEKIAGNDNDNEFVEDIEWYEPGEKPLHGEWKETENKMKHLRAAHYSAVYDNVYYLFGGLAHGGPKSEVYKMRKMQNSNNGDDNKKRYEWGQLPSLRGPRYYGATASIGSHIYIIGGLVGHNNSDLVEVFDAQSETFQQSFSVSFARCGMATAVLDSQIYVIGGYENGTQDIVGYVNLLDMTTSVTEDAAMIQPEKTITAEAYPNPFNSTVKLEATIPLSGNYRVVIFNLLGQKIKDIGGSYLNSGRHTFVWNATDELMNPVAAGVYFISIRNHKQHKLVKLIYVK